MNDCYELILHAWDLEDSDDEADQEGAGEDDDVDNLDPFSDSDD